MAKAGNTDMRYMGNFMEESCKTIKISILLAEIGKGKMVQMTEKVSPRHGVLIYVMQGSQRHISSLNKVL